MIVVICLSVFAQASGRLRSKSTTMNGFHPDIGRLSLGEAALPAEAGEGDKEDLQEDDDMGFDNEVDDDFDRHAFGLYQQLPVSPGQPDLASEPQTAEEYLQRVRCGSFHDLTAQAHIFCAHDCLS